MTEDTIVAVYDTATQAEAAVASLIAAGHPARAITQHAASADPAGRQPARTPAVAPREQGFWSNLFGGEPERDSAVYDRSVAGGAVVVTVRTDAAQVASVMEILEGHNPVDIDERASGYGLAQPAPPAGGPIATPGPGLTAAAAVPGEDATIPLAEETLSVGKRLVNRGGTRVRRFVVETPVEQTVSLRSEKVTLDRRPVGDGRPVSAADFGERTIELTESVEEPVVSKTARVVEEVRLRKEATESVETVRDTVRKEEVEIEQLPGGAALADPARREPKV